MIAIIDYGMGNLRSVSKAFEHLGFRSGLVRDPRMLSSATHVVLPGVGAFPDCMRNLAEFNLIDPIRHWIEEGRPFLGICLGLQLLFSESEEFGIHPGMGVLKGRVVRFLPSNHRKIPHMGWNQVNLVKTTPVLEGIKEDEAFYFVHSYFVVPEDKEIVCTETEYGQPFVSSVIARNIFACQFHPEKSQAAGLKVLKNFAEWNPRR
jgi:imidazole glycerol-phosphate synthase subunit HisH